MVNFTVHLKMAEHDCIRLKVTAALVSSRSVFDSQALDTGTSSRCQLIVFLGTSGRVERSRCRALKLCSAEARGFCRHSRAAVFLHLNIHSINVTFVPNSDPIWVFFSCQFPFLHPELRNACSVVFGRRPRRP